MTRTEKTLLLMYVCDLRKQTGAGVERLMKTLIMTLWRRNTSFNPYMKMVAEKLLLVWYCL